MEHQFHEQQPGTTTSRAQYQSETRNTNFLSNNIKVKHSFHRENQSETTISRAQYQSETRNTNFMSNIMEPPHRKNQSETTIS
mgnify:CR=1 FL=1